jgi:hypothetical protein
MNERRREWRNLEGLLNRLNGPAEILGAANPPDQFHWYKNGIRHRSDNGLAMYHNAGILKWFRNGKVHREHGPAEIRTFDNVLLWKIDDKLHREDQL